MSNTGGTSYNPALPDGRGYSIGIVSTAWNSEIISALLTGCKTTLENAGTASASIHHYEVPGSVELPLGAQWLIERIPDLDAVVCLGTVIRGDTSHFDYVCQAATKGIMDVSLKFSKPVIFGVLTVENLQQALDRAGGKHGNKGSEAAISALQMAELNKKLRYDTL